MGRDTRSIVEPAEALPCGTRASSRLLPPSNRTRWRCRWWVVTGAFDPCSRSCRACEPTGSSPRSCEPCRTRTPERSCARTAGMPPVCCVKSSADQSTRVRIRQLLEAVVPGTVDVRPKRHGNKLTLEFTQDGAGAEPVKFEAFSMSDGTLRDLGMIMAVLQRPAPSVLVVEEPEASMHPGALGSIRRADPVWPAGILDRGRVKRATTPIQPRVAADPPAAARSPA